MKRFFDESRRNRLKISILAGMLAAALAAPADGPARAADAWWGVLYPQFCCISQEQAKVGENHPVKVNIKFRWLHG